MSLQLDVSSANPLTQRVDALAICVSKLPLEGVAGDVDEALGGALSDHVKQSEFKPKANQVLDVATTGRIKARKVVLIGIKPDAGEAEVRVAASNAARNCMAGNARAIALVIPQLDGAVRAAAEGVVMGAYRFTKYLTGDRLPKAELGKVTLLLSRKPSAADKRQAELGRQVGEAVGVARDAVNEPPNELTPAALAAIARQLATKHKFSIKVLDKKGIRAAGMNLHYAVGQGSVNEPRFIHMSYRPKGAKKKLVFVGKGITFDSGGLCIKPASGMGDMKSDMGGAAAVLGLMTAVAAVKPKVEVHGIIGGAENMPDGAAYRPGDVFGSLNGKTVEIINTDAEGRLVLADALTYASRLKPDLIVDAATLTGAMIVALGKTTTGYFATSDEIAQQLNAAASLAGEGFWRMPLIDELSEQLKSDVADLKHTGDRWGGAITAALFLREFVGDVPWVHCDIAGPSMSDRARGVAPKGATGQPVLTFLRLVESF